MWVGSFYKASNCPVSDVKSFCNNPEKLLGRTINADGMTELIVDGLEDIADGSI